MDDLGFGRLVRLARIRRGWRQQDLAERAGISRTTLSRLERGHLEELQIGIVRRVCAPLDIRVEVLARARAIEVDTIFNARHSALSSFVSSWIAGFDGWSVRAEVTYSEYGERGSIDLLCWHAASRSLLVIEIKTELLEFGEVLAKLDEKRRLASRIARRFDWVPDSVSSCLLVADSTTNRRRAAAHGSLIRAALPDDARTLVRWLKSPVGSIAAVRFVPDVRPGNVRNGFSAPTRVRTPPAAANRGQSRSDRARRAGG